MKKVFGILPLFLSLILYSCASTVPAEEETFIPEEVVVQEPENDTAEEENNVVPPVEEENDVEKTQSENLSEIEEPLVRDLILPPVVEEKTEEPAPETEITPIPEEKIDELEELPPLPSEKDENPIASAEENQSEETTVTEPEIKETSETSENVETNEDANASVNENSDETSENSVTETSEEQQEQDATNENPESTDSNQNDENSENLENPDSTIETEENTEPAEEDENLEEEEIEEGPVIKPSRSVTMNKGETLSVSYPGSGWVYMGSLSEYNNLASKGRKLGATDTKYTLLAKQPGTQIHHFYKEDNLTGTYIDDYLEVIVLEKKGSSKTVITAPDYVEVVPEKPEDSISKIMTEDEEEYENQISTTIKTDTTDSDFNNSALISTNVENAPQEPEAPLENKTQTSDRKTKGKKTKNKNYEEDEIMFIDNTPVEEVEILDISEPAPVVNTNEILDKAQAAYSNNDYNETQTLLNQFFEYATERRDEALFLQGQLLEQNSELKDIKASVNSYQNLIDNYPASSYWDAANKRIIYLKRFYIEVR